MRKSCPALARNKYFTNPPREYLEQLLLRTGKLRERDLTLEKIAMELIRKSPRTIRRAQ